MNSSYYKNQMNTLNQQIKDKKKRKSTCESVKKNLDNCNVYSSIASALSDASHNLSEGLFNMDIVLAAPDELLQDREKPPYSDSRISDATYSLAAEIRRLNTEIDSLEQQLNTASANYRKAKDREWKETLERLNLI